MIRTQIYLPEPLYNDIKRRARAKGEPAAQLIRHTLEQSLYHGKAAVEPAPRKSWAKIAEELNIRGDPKDLSRRIDDYLYGDE